MCVWGVFVWAVCVGYVCGLCVGLCVWGLCVGCVCMMIIGDAMSKGTNNTIIEHI